MSPDWPLWALGSFATGTVYAVSVAVLNRRNHNARGRRWMLAAEVAGATNQVAQPASNRQPKNRERRDAMIPHTDFGLMIKDWDDPAFDRMLAIQRQTAAAEERRMRELGYEPYYDIYWHEMRYRKVLTPRERLEQRIAAIDARIDYLLGNLPEPGGEWQGARGDEHYVESGVDHLYAEAANDAQVGRLFRKLDALKAQLGAMA